MRCRMRCGRRSQSRRDAWRREILTTTRRCAWMRRPRWRFIRGRVQRVRRGLVKLQCRRSRLRCAMRFMRRPRRGFGRWRFWVELAIAKAAKKSVEIQLMTEHGNLECLPGMLWGVLLACLLSAGAVSVTAQTAASVSPTQRATSVPATRLARLRRGINASEWFAQVYDKRGYTRENFRDGTPAEDIALIKSMGFDHVRLSVNPQPMMPGHRPDEIPAEYFGYLDAAVKMILDQGTAVGVDLHPERDFKEGRGERD